MMTISGSDAAMAAIRNGGMWARHLLAAGGIIRLTRYCAALNEIASRSGI